MGVRKSPEWILMRLNGNCAIYPYKMSRRYYQDTIQIVTGLPGSS